MIGYPKWIEDPEKLDKYYENVSREESESKYSSRSNALRQYSVQKLKQRKAKPIILRLTQKRAR